MAVRHQIGNNKNKFLCECDYCHKEFVCRTFSCVYFEKTFCPECLKSYDKEEYSLVRFFYPNLNRKVVQGINDLHTKSHRDKAYKIKVYKKNKEQVGVFRMEELIKFLKKQNLTRSDDFHIGESIRRICRKEKYRNSYLGYVYEYDKSNSKEVE